MAELNDDDLSSIRETYGLVQRLDQKMTDHLHWSEKMSQVRNQEIKDLGDRLKPVEEFHTDFKKAMKLSAYVGVPTIAALGAMFSEGVKKLFKHMMGNP